MLRRSSLAPAVAAAFLFAVSGFPDQVSARRSIGLAGQGAGVVSDHLVSLRPPITNATTNRSYAPVPPAGVLVRDASTGQVIKTIPVATGIVQVVVNPHTHFIYAISRSGVLTVVDGLRDTVVAALVAGPSATAIGINTVTNRIYVGTSAGLTVIDGYTRAVVATLPGVYADPDIAVNETTDRIYATSIHENLLRAVDGRTHGVVAALAVGDRPAGVTVDALNNRVYVANSGVPIAGAGDTVTVVDADHHETVATLSVGSEDAVWLAIDPLRRGLAVTMSSGPTVILETESGFGMPSTSRGPTAMTAETTATAATTEIESQDVDDVVSVPMVPASTAAGASVFNLRVATDASPDLTDLPSFLASTTSGWSSDREKVWALFYWLHVLKRQTAPIVRHGFELTDPIRNLLNYGYTMCSTASGMNQSLFEGLGLRHQYWDICNHTVAAVEYDGAFRMIDSSMSNLVTTDDGVTLATVEEAAADGGRLALNRSLYSSSPGGFLTGTDIARSLSDIISPVDGSILYGFARAFCEAGLKLRDYYYNWESGHRYVLNLRPDESYTRFYRRLGDTPDYWVSSEDIAAPDPAKTFEIDPDNKFGLRGNGRWTFVPGLARDTWSRAVYQSSNVAPAAAGGLQPEAPGAAGDVIYKVQAADAIASQAIRAQFARPHLSGSARIAVSVNHGITWTDVADSSAASGSAVALAVTLRDQVNGVYETLVRIRMDSGGVPGAIVLSELVIETLTQVNTKALPKLNVGRNRIYIDPGAQTDTMVLWPELRGDRWQRDVYASSNIATQPLSVPRTHTAVAYPAVLTQDAHLTYRMHAPSDITRVVYGGRLHNFAPGSYIDFLHSFDGGVTWIQSYRLSDVSKPYDVIHYETVTDIPAGVRTVLFKYLMHNTSTVHSRASGLYAARMEVHHRPVTDVPAPLDVTVRWQEIQPDRATVARSHRQRVLEYPFTYVINVGGIDHPVMDSLSLSVAKATDTTAQGYSDGVDAGGEKYRHVKRHDGTNLAQRRPYTVSRPPSSFQSSHGAGNTTILTDGMVGAPTTGGYAYWFGQCWSPGTPLTLQVDLGSLQTVGAVRAHLFGYPFWDALKGEVQDQVEILTSADGVSFVSQGFLETSLLRRNIPINYMLQDDERATAWNFQRKLPASVSARYVRYYTVPQRHLCVSELQVMDRVEELPFDIRIAPPANFSRGPAVPPPPPPPPPTPVLPAPWVAQDIGLVGLEGHAAFDAATEAFTIAGAGADIWGTADAFRFVYRPLTGDGDIVARVASVQNGHAWVKAGVMIRADLTPGSAHAMMIVTPGKGNNFQRRVTAGGISSSTAGSFVTAPQWVKLSRRGDTITAFESADGSTWRTVGAETIPMAAGVHVGLEVSSHSASALATAVFDRVSLTIPVVVPPPPPPPPPPSGLPTPWATADIGAVGLTGSASFASATATYSVTGAGADIWGTADAFRYVYQPLTGDGEIVARVATIEAVHAWVKAGVMIRESLSPDAPHGIMMVTPGKGNNFQRRVLAGGVSTSTAGSKVTAPYWVRLRRAGDVLTASESPDGVTWTTVGTATIVMPANVLMGLAVSSHVTTAAATATFDRVETITSAGPPPVEEPEPPDVPAPWQTQDIGATGLAGAASFVPETATWSMAGAGADIWGTADAFRYVYQALAGDGEIAARVTSVENAAAWVKAGVMIRAELTPGSAHGMMMVTPGKGNNFQRRTAGGGTSNSTAGSFVTAPYWVKLARLGDTITAYESPDGMTWKTVGSAAIPMPSVVFVGLALSSHSATALATATFDQVRVTVR